MDRYTIKQYGLRYLGIKGELRLGFGTYYTTDTWYSKKLRGIVAKFYNTYYDTYTVMKTARDKCWIQLC